jgi:hypothetical protein
MAYAFDLENTTIEIIPENEAQKEGSFGDHDNVTVRVTHRFYLGIPLANRILGTSYDAGGMPGFFYAISEQYTLLNEGEPLGA